MRQKARAQNSRAITNLKLASSLSLSPRVSLKYEQTLCLSFNSKKKSISQGNKKLLHEFPLFNFGFPLGRIFFFFFLGFFFCFFFFFFGLFLLMFFFSRSLSLSSKQCATLPLCLSLSVSLSLSLQLRVIGLGFRFSFVGLSIFRALTVLWNK